MLKIKKYNLLTHTRQEWLDAFSKKGFFVRLFISIIWIIGLIIFMGYYFLYIEARKGKVLNDWILNSLPAKDFSLYIFGLLYPVITLGLLYLFTKPFILLRVLETAAIVYSLRVITLYLIKLDPPEGFIPLIDPVAHHLKYGGKLITKDLFFSGHTTSLLILFLAIKNRWLKAFFLIAVVSMIIMLLWQHVHYTIDIIGAIFFTLSGWRITQTGFFNKAL